MRTVVLRLFGIVTCFLLCISLIRIAYGVAEPLTLSGFLNALQTIDFSFSNTYSSLVQISQVFQSIQIGGIDVIVDIARAIYNVIMLPINLLRDLLIAVGSTLGFVFQLVGFAF